jgi:2-polyprenyl-6-methoxyphenol hydroxylase-like FAD-dependent oxidoreductase
MTDNSNSAVVIGASVAGLLAASALSDHFDRILILEREVLPPPGQGRKAVPQGRHVHALLPGGLAAIEQLLPGFQAELVAGGAVRCDSMQDIRFVASGHEISRDAASATNILASRPYIVTFGDASSTCQTSRWLTAPPCTGLSLLLTGCALPGSGCQTRS